MTVVREGTMNAQKKKDLFSYLLLFDDFAI